MASPSVMMTVQDQSLSVPPAPIIVIKQYILLFYFSIIIIIMLLGVLFGDFCVIEIGRFHIGDFFKISLKKNSCVNISFYYAT